MYHGPLKRSCSLCDPYSIHLQVHALDPELASVLRLSYSCVAALGVRAVVPELPDNCREPTFAVAGTELLGITSFFGLFFVHVLP